LSKTNTENLVKSQILLPVFCGYVLAGSLATAEVDFFVPKNPPKIEMPQTQNAEMDLMRWANESFYKDMTDRVQALSAGFSTGRLIVLLDIAELYLSQMMMLEARFVVEDIEVSELPGDQKVRWQQMVDVIAILERGGLAGTENSPLFDQTRRDRQFWIVLNAIALGDSTSLVENIEGAFNSRKLVPRAVTRAVLPALVETMIETGEYALADRAIAVLEGFAEYSASSTAYFLRGRMAQKQQKDKTALEFFLLAANGWDKYAARARLKLADTAIESGRNEAYVAAQGILEFGINAWRGDRFELMTLERLAEVNRLAQQPYKTLLTNSKIVERFPGSDAAEQALQSSEKDIRTLYESGVRGEISISDWLEMHLRLVPIYRQLPAFSEITEMFADRILELGATDYAIAEYDRALDLLYILQESSNKPVLPSRISSLQLKKADALIQGGRYEDAKKILSQIPASGDDVLEARNEKLAARVFSALGDSVSVLTGTEQNLSGQYLRQRAFAYWKTGEWTLSTESYKRLWRDYAGEFSIADASYLLIAARRGGDASTAKSVADAFPELTESAWLTTMAERLLEAPADISSLSINGAEDRILSADKTLKKLGDNGL
jgi:hypothetical protein